MALRESIRRAKAKAFFVLEEATWGRLLCANGVLLPIASERCRQPLPDRAARWTQQRRVGQLPDRVLPHGHKLNCV